MISTIGLRLFFAAFAFSGFAGLIYESVWAQYLKLFLGHAAYAQTLVLVIFMGGMAGGAWLAGRRSRTLANPLLWYVGAEVLLGLAAFAFDGLFRGMQQWVFETAVPNAPSAASIDFIKWILAAAMIFPQSILLGATFPLIGAGILRYAGDDAGRTLSWLYFTNSIGAAIGVLVSGFFLIDKVGLPGTVATAGLINLALAAVVMILARAIKVSEAEVASPPVPQTPSSAKNLAGLLLAIAFLTGAGSFFYEIGWIRMLSLVLGSTTHSFELMLSAFIMGLASGAFWIRNRIHSAQAPLRLLGVVQVCMAVFALVSVPIYMQLFELMARFWHAVQSNDDGYALFTMFSYAVCFTLMLPATFCAGMTLPLITAALMKSRADESGIGLVYAANTAGAIAGIVFAVHLVMPYLGLRQVVVAGAVIDGAAGLWLLWRFRPEYSFRAVTVAAAVAVCALALALATDFDPRITGSGAYRVGKPELEGSILFHKDGKTATVHVAQHPDGTISIATNGKVDGGLAVDGAPGPDDYTTILLALLPISFHPQASSVAVVGMGTGSTTHSLLFNPRLETVDTIEIEPAMIEGARFFGAAAEKAFTDSRSRVRIEDAKTYFAREGRQYDLILSEPSNPWVSGIASLFSAEFYGQIRRYLRPDALFVQWLQLYEIDLYSIATVMNALGRNFEDYAVFAANEDDIIIVAKADGALPAMDPWIFSQPAMRQPLQRLGMQRIDDLKFRMVGRKATLSNYFSLAPKENSDYFPVLDQRVARPRFLNTRVTELLGLHPYASRLEGRRDDAYLPLSPLPFYQPVPGNALRARALADQLLSARSSAGILTAEQRAAEAILRLLQKPCRSAVPAEAIHASLRDFSMAAAHYLTPAQVTAVVGKLRECRPLLDPTASAWIDLFEGLGLDNPELVRSAALQLLGSLQQDIFAAQFVVSELMLADLHLEGPGAASARLRSMQGLPESLVMSYIRANLEARAAAVK